MKDIETGHLPVEQRQSKVASIPMRRKRNLAQRPEIIHPVQMRGVRVGVVTTKKKIDGIWLP